MQDIQSVPTLFLTPYPDVNAALNDLFSRARGILANNFVGMYLHGSLASGDFDPNTSDIDFLVVTAAEITDEIFSALESMHARIAASDSKWATELEGAYISQRALQRYDPTQPRFPSIGRHRDAYLRLEKHDSDGVIKRHVLREHGIVIAGPSPQTLIDPISTNELRRAVAEILRDWWSPMLDNPARLQSVGYRAYAILTMCRAQFTLQHGRIVSKPVAARWTQKNLGARWKLLIDWALANPRDPSIDNLSETRELIRVTVERARRFELLSADGKISVGS